MYAFLCVNENQTWEQHRFTKQSKQREDSYHGSEAHILTRDIYIYIYIYIYDNISVTCGLLSPEQV